MSIRFVGIILCTGWFSFVGISNAQEKSAQPPCEPELLMTLPVICPTPDGMAMDADGNIVLACPNYGDKEHPAVLMKITPENKILLFCQVPVHSQTGTACPMGIDFGPDGDLFIVDNQDWGKSEEETKNLGRILRLDIQNGRWVGTSLVAYGMKHPNGIRVHEGGIYVTHSMITKDKDDDLLLSGVYRFELNPAPERVDENTWVRKPVKVNNTLDDENLLVTIKTLNKDCQYGADGLAFDSKGNLYVANFGDAVIHKITFDKDGNVEKQERFAKDECMKSIDGICIDKDDNIYAADFSANAICLITPEGKVSVLAKSPDCDGSKGGLDQPGEPIVRGEELIIANFDMVTGDDKLNSEHDDVQNLSVIRPPTLAENGGKKKEKEEKKEDKSSE